MNFLASLTLPDLTKFLAIIQGSMRVRSHNDLFNWLHGEMQDFLPHDIMIAAWGDFNLKLVHLDVVSYLPGMRTTEIDREELLPILTGLFNRWVGIGHIPFNLPMDHQAFITKPEGPETILEKALLDMKSAIVHGIKDQRGRHDCLYVALSVNHSAEDRTAHAMELMLPYIDTALRQVTHLPEQYSDAIRYEPVITDSVTAEEIAQEFSDAFGLTFREREIMRWVSMGKTNHEIGSILNISSYTVKNHLQRIFRKLDVINRAQAVAYFDRPTSNSDA